ncbi:hypothetical protein FA15DRAFT_744421 [Coprinopsis marcescibilis]|uniref:Uncharacterized protein n=1 Tax=Coprinopsis marcescibilis TaxID=230819 RepID=A0A5C3K999_COPMA|nr:hypothetical protein FA15DRAFT_744421 [Coprinopsis marcescibilis]
MSSSRDSPRVGRLRASDAALPQWSSAPLTVPPIPSSDDQLNLASPASRPSSSLSQSRGSATPTWQQYAANTPAPPPPPPKDPLEGGLTLEPETVEEDFEAVTLALETITSLLRTCNKYPDDYPLRDPLLIWNALKDFSAALDLPAWQKICHPSRASISEDEDVTICIPVAPRPTFAPRGPSPPRQSTLPHLSPPVEDTVTPAPTRPREGQSSHPVSRPQPKKPVVPFQCPTPGPPPPVNRATRPLPQSSSYASAVRKALAGPSLVNLARAAPNLSVKRLLEVQREAEGPSKKKKKTTSTPSFTSQGPLQKQVHVMFEGKAIPTGFPINILMVGCNAALTHTNGTTCVLAAQLAYDGLSLSTMSVANPKDIDTICAKVLEVYPASHKDKTWVGLLTLTSYLKVVDVPYFKNITDSTLQRPWEHRIEPPCFPLSIVHSLTIGLQVCSHTVNTSSFPDYRTPVSLVEYQSTTSCLLSTGYGPWHYCADYLSCVAE